jgi:class 3 adenylate cyclase/tetratricopeptide (TPR) repeat protein
VSEAERRQLTVLFCDLVESTSLSDRMDPEAFRELVLAYQNTVSEVVGRYNGHIAQYLGDGMLVYFGYPAAQDDDAERAVRAGYAMLQALTHLELPLPLREGIEGRDMQARIGIHTGPVVVGPMGGTGRSETLAIGATTNVAARLQGLAQPHTLVISGDTLKLVPGLFVTKDLGAQPIKGIDKPLPIYQIIQPSGVRTRLEAAEHLTPFVGRQQELALLNDRWQQATEGRGQAVLLTAEPGLGKSRLLLTLREQVQDSAHSWLECRCAPMTRNSAFAPTMELLTRGLQLKEGDSDAIKLQRLELALDMIGQDRQEAVPLLAPLLNLNLPKHHSPSPYGPELKRKKVLALLVDWTLALARQQPLLLAIEDLHWADPSSLDLLALMIEQIPSHNVLVLFTARPEFQPNWPMRSHLAVLALQPLRSKDTGQMLLNLTGNKALPAPVQEMLLQRAGGVPLFLEEITKTLLESGQLVEADGKLKLKGRLEDLAIPATLQDSLAARIDRLGDAKLLIQLCAVIGREIPYRLLTQVADTDEAVLQQHLKTLTDSQLLYARGSPPDSNYLFKHALIQDSAYNSLLKSTRQKLHGRIADALEQHFKERAKAEPAVLAEHFEKAGAIEQAVKYYKAAGEAAGTRTAVGEAVSFCEKALKLLPLLPEGASKDRTELALLSSLFPWVAVARGYAHPEVRSAVERARSLFATANDPMAQAMILIGSWVAYHFSGQYELALKCAKEVAGFGKSIGVPVVESWGYANAAHSCYFLGRHSDVLASTEAALRFPDLESARALAKTLGGDSVINALFIRALTKWALGYPDEALALAHQTVARAQKLGIPIVSCLAATWGPPFVLRFRRQAETLLEACTSCAAINDRYGYTAGGLYTSANRGVALGMLGRPDEALTLLRQSINSFESTGAMLLVSWNYADMAAIYLAAGRLGEARAALDRAFELMGKHNERIWEAELHRLKGELLLAESCRPREGGDPVQQQEKLDSRLRGNDDKEGKDGKAAEACFHKALEVSRSQQAKSLELRAATSLARLWQKQNRGSEARDLLKPVYDWFTEGFDTPDLKDAKALLDILIR